VKEVAVYIAATLAFHLMLRVSEYTGKSMDGSKSPHAIRGCDVVIQYSRGNGGQTLAMQAADWAVSLDVVVSGIIIVIKSSKTLSTNDESVRHYLGAGDSIPLNELVSDLLWWTENARPGGTDLFFSYPCYVNQRRNLTSREVSSFVKRLARDHDLPDRGFSTHSLRVGGASAMSSGGVELETINQAGRWASNSLAAIKYRNPTVRGIGALSGVLGTAESTVLDTIRLNNSLTNQKSTLRDTSRRSDA
jgi:hypothetical protein